MTGKSEVVLANPESFQASHHWRVNRNRTYLVLSMFLSLVLGFGISNLINSRVISKQDYQLKTSGIINLSEDELIEIADGHNLPIYWSGPIQGYTYSLILDSEGSSILKYIPESGTATYLKGAQREIATYQAAEGWDKSIVAANKIGINSFRNADGSLVFYGLNNASDVFMAFEDEDLQVEIFDSRAGQALSLAMLAGQIRPVVNHETD